MKKSVALAMALIYISLIIAGCGETVSGIRKDAKRVGKGIKTIFVKDN